MILVSNSALDRCRQSTEARENLPFPAPFIEMDGGEAFVCSLDLPIFEGRSRRRVAGLLYLGNLEELGTGKAAALLSGREELPASTVMVPVPADGRLPTKGWVLADGRIEQREIRVVDLGEELFSRIRGLYETDRLSKRSVLVLGLGSGGSQIAIDLAKAGVGGFFLVDHDRLDVCNLVRHACGLSDLGRFKTRAVRDLILEKNPGCQVETFQQEIRWAWHEELRRLVRSVDLVFCCTDNRASRQQVNVACLAEARKAIYGGTFRRAYGGHALRVVPSKTLCYQCFIDLFAEKISDYEVATPAAAARIGYDDRMGPVEPGLAADIAPIANFCVKLGLLELLRGESTTLAPLFDDLAKDWFQWLNRREPGTDYEQLPPLDSGEDSLRILAWYGIETERNPYCPTCGDFATLYGGGVPDESLERFHGAEMETGDRPRFPLVD